MESTGGHGGIDFPRSVRFPTDFGGPILDNGSAFSGPGGIRGKYFYFSFSGTCFVDTFTYAPGSFHIMLPTSG